MPHRVLVADTDQALQVLLNVILSRAGFDVDFASSGREALRKATADSYDAIMLGLIFPDLTGLEVIEHLKDRKPDSLRKIIVLTGATRAVIDRVDTSRIHALLRKPFDLSDIIRVTAECANDGK